MRWLVIHPGPEWAVADVHNGITEALQAAGEEVLEYNLGDRLRLFGAALVETGECDADGNPQVRRALSREQSLAMAAENVWAQAYRWWPHVVLGISAFFTPPPLLDLMRVRGHKVILWHTEVPYQDEEQLERAAHADLNIVNDPATLDAYRAHGPAEYFGHCYRPDVHHPGPGRPELKSDLAFVGTGFPSRRKFLEQMDLDGLDVLLAGHWPGLAASSPLRRFLADPQMGSEAGVSASLDNDQAAEVYRSARAGINLYRQEGEDGMTPGVAMGPREIEMSACQLWFPRDPRPEGNEVLSMLPTFSSPEEASELVRWHLAHDDVRERQARQAREAIADRTFESAARRLLRLVEKL